MAPTEQTLGITFSWTTEYAFSVDLNTEKEGEWVNTGFTAKADNPQNGVKKSIMNGTTLKMKNLNSGIKQ
jgi:hypothetical protein